MFVDAADNDDAWDVKNIVCHCFFALCCACNLITQWNESDMMTKSRTSIWNLTNIDECSEQTLKWIEIKEKEKHEAQSINKTVN